MPTLSQITLSCKPTSRWTLKHFVRYLWPTPQETPWSQVPDIAQPVPFQAGNPTEQYAEVWQQRETSAQEVLQHAWSPQMRGRGQRTSTITKKGWPTPPKQGRSRDPQPGFYGYDVQHARWLKQLRRLVNYNNWAPKQLACSLRSILDTWALALA